MTEQIDLDTHSLHLLEALQEDAQLTVQQLSDRIGLSTTPVWKRVKDMQANGVIRGYTVLIDPEKVGLGLRVVVEANLGQHSEDAVRRFERAVASCPQIVQCFSTTGQADYLMTIVVPDIKRYEQFLHDTLFKLPGITHVRSSIVLKEVKRDAKLPLAYRTRAARPAAR